MSTATATTTVNTFIANMDVTVREAYVRHFYLCRVEEVPRGVLYENLPGPDADESFVWLKVVMAVLMENSIALNRDVFYLHPYQRRAEIAYEVYHTMTKGEGNYPTFDLLNGVESGYWRDIVAGIVWRNS